jgi:hypothetical protein
VFHPVFQEFLGRINDPGFHPDLEIASAASDFMYKASQMYSKETDPWGELRPCLRRLLSRNLNPRAAMGTRIADGLASIVVENMDVPLLCLEYKRGFCESGCDPSIQAAYYTRDFLVVDKVCDFQTFSHLC